MTINEIIATINAKLESERMNVYEAASMINGMFPKLLLQRERGVYLSARRGDSHVDLIRIKMKRKKVEKENRRPWGDRYEYVVQSISLDTPEVGGSTLDGILEDYRSQVQAAREKNDEQARQDYLAIKAVMDKTGMTMDELYRFMGIISKRHYQWDKMIEHYGDERPAERPLFATLGEQSADLA